MSVTRIGEALQPAWARATSIVAGTGSTFGTKTQTILERTRAAATLRFFEQLAKICVALLTPASLAALALGLWRLSADLDWTEAFPIPSGFFSHWQVWIALAIGLRLFASWMSAGSDTNAKTSEEN